MWHSIPMSFYWEKISQFSFPIYDLKIVATVMSKERRNSSLTWSFYFCISGQFCSLWVVPFHLWSFPFVCFCGFLPIVPLLFVYFIPVPQLYVTTPFLQGTMLFFCAIWSHWFISCSYPPQGPHSSVWVSLSNSGLLPNLIWFVLKILGNIRPISSPMELHLISLPCFLPCQKSRYNKDK